MQLHLKLPADSPWNEVCAVLHRSDWDLSTRKVQPSSAISSFALLFMPIRINLSAQLCAFVAEILISLAQAAESREEKAATNVSKEQEEKPGSECGRCLDFDFLVSLRSAEILLFRESNSKSLDSFASFQVIDMEVALLKIGKSLTLQASVVDAFVFDLSCRPGANGLARRYYRREHENETGLHRDILSINASFAELNGTAAAKVNLHFGNMRCIVLPSLLQGILAFKAESFLASKFSSPISPAKIYRGIKILASNLSLSLSLLLATLDYYLRETYEAQYFISRAPPLLF